MLFFNGGGVCVFPDTRGSFIFCKTDKVSENPRRLGIPGFAFSRFYSDSSVRKNVDVIRQSCQQQVSKRVI